MNREVRVGLMFTLSLIILGGALYYLGSFQEMVSYKIKFDKVIGLAVDNPVHFNGVPIGRVTKIVLSEDTEVLGSVPIIVTIAVHRSVKNHIRTSTRAEIKSIGILGDKSILLVTPNYSVDILEEGAFIQPSAKMLDVDKLLAQGTDMVADVTEITDDLKLILGKISKEDGALQRLIGDKDMADDLKKIIALMRGYLDHDDNAMSLMLKDPEFARNLKTGLETLVRDLSLIMEQYKSGEGLLPALMTDEAMKKDFQVKLNGLLDSSTAYVESLSQSRGLLYRMTQDEEYGERVAKNLEKASYHLASILEKIDEGDGSAAMMVNDPSLYEGLYEVVYGVQNSGITKWYIRKKQKKGAELMEKEQKKEETQ